MKSILCFKIANFCIFSIRNDQYYFLKLIRFPET
jgi:hypothetical protein